VGRSEGDDHSPPTQIRGICAPAADDLDRDPSRRFFPNFLARVLDHRFFNLLSTRFQGK